MKSKFLFCFSLILGVSLYAQIENNRSFEFQYKPPEKYLGLDNKEIGNISFIERTKKDHIHFASYEYEDTLYYHLQLSYYFSQLPDTKKMLLFNYLSREHDVDTTKIMVIHYADSLRSIESFPKSDTIIYDDSGRHKHLYSLETYLNQNRDCNEKFKKNKKCNVYHFVKNPNNNPLEYQGAKWYFDKRSSLFNIFNLTIKTFVMAVIHPDGRYFVYNRFDTNKPGIIYDKLIKNKRWDKYYAEFMNKFKF